MPGSHHFLCEDMTTMLEESHCKYYKRLLVGLLRYLGGEISVPGDFFEVEINEGFVVDPDEEWTFSLTNDWKFEEDDCGHIQHDDVTFDPNSDIPNLVVLKGKDKDD